MDNPQNHKETGFVWFFLQEETVFLESGKYY
jgi:hypothetical protein